MHIINRHLLYHHGLRQDFPRFPAVFLSAQAVFQCGVTKLPLSRFTAQRRTKTLRTTHTILNDCNEMSNSFDSTNSTYLKAYHVSNTTPQKPDPSVPLFANDNVHCHDRDHVYGHGIDMTMTMTLIVTLAFHCRCLGVYLRYLLSIRLCQCP